ncbi:MAG: hypothetical protein LIP08_03150 [Bacteroides sp.]|nr:hypothetical protein [Bacteroides sp.]
MMCTSRSVEKLLEYTVYHGDGLFSFLFFVDGSYVFFFSIVLFGNVVVFSNVFYQKKFFYPVKTRCGVFWNDLHFANPSAKHWQSFATWLARYCHPVGKVLPSHWQNLANRVAKHGQFTGKRRTLYWENMADLLVKQE